MAEGFMSPIRYGIANLLCKLQCDVEYLDVVGLHATCSVTP